VRQDNVFTCDKLHTFHHYDSASMSKTKLLNIRIDPELKKRAKKLAEADGRSLSNWVTKLIASTVEQAERDPPDKGSR
jgi:predicted HicB family RNase H-like nuclease